MSQPKRFSIPGLFARHLTQWALLHLFLMLLIVFVPWFASGGAIETFQESPGWLILTVYVAFLHTIPFAVISLVVNVVALGYLNGYTLLYKILSVVVLGAVVGFLFASTPFFVPTYAAMVLTLVPVQLFFFVRKFKKLDASET